MLQQFPQNDPVWSHNGVTRNADQRIYSIGPILSVSTGARFSRECMDNLILFVGERSSLDAPAKDAG